MRNGRWKEKEMVEIETAERGIRWIEAVDCGESGGERETAVWIGKAMRKIRRRGIDEDDDKSDWTLVDQIRERMVKAYGEMSDSTAIVRKMRD